MTAPKQPKTVDLAAFKEVGEFSLKSSETPDEHTSRLTREEAEADHKLRMHEAEETHKRKLSL
ncbi:hypothetical protein SAMN05444166_2406 [Singulisphaera sp. GP187]|uniref:hypothetical protein n=1 Tax=Singulisphaera sp. GP187 TaxID=1882752 RepID=UPI0009289506|nr:hypothetical protein [Singulisphaera sp. GP187]SIO09318.1 hypothetical protein SAMN05444166_2406 [Singulisphaera sp. GP187]